MDEGQKLARLALEFPELTAAECGAALQAQAGNLAAAVAILDMHVSAVCTWLAFLVAISCRGSAHLSRLAFCCESLCCEVLASSSLC